MVTIKSYTDLQQSKKLAEILPLESADMYYPWYIEEDGDTIESGHRITTPNVGNFTTHKVNKMILPCWSLSALLGVLPEIQGGKPVIALDDNYITYPHMSDLHTKSDNIVDACVAMIERLHELEML